MYIFTMGADILDSAIAWNLKLFIFTGKAHKNISWKHWIVDFQINKLYFQNLFFFFFFFSNEKILKSESFWSYDKLYLHIITRTGELPSFAIAGRPAGFVNDDGAEAREAFVRG